jgi:hypothetical protein
VADGEVSVSGRHNAIGDLMITTSRIRATLVVAGLIATLGACEPTTTSSDSGGGGPREATTSECEANYRARDRTYAENDHDTFIQNCTHAQADWKSIVEGG